MVPGFSSQERGWWASVIFELRSGFGANIVKPDPQIMSRNPPCRGVDRGSSLDRGTSSLSGCSSWSESFGNFIGEGFFFFTSFFLMAITTGDFLFLIGVSGALI